MIPQSQQMEEEEDNTNHFLNPLNECGSDEDTINESSMSSADSSVNEMKSSTNCVVNDPPLETMKLPKDQVTGEIFFPFDPYRHCSVFSFISASSLRYLLYYY